MEKRAVTTTQQAYLDFRREFREEIARRAVSDRPIELPKPPKGVTGTEAERLRRLRQEANRTERETREQEEAKARRDAWRLTCRAVYDAQFGRDKLGGILRAVSEASGVSTAALVSRCRTKNIVPYRQLFCALARHLTTKSLPEIATALGGRDHTTVLHAVRKLQPIIVQLKERMPADATTNEWAQSGVELVKSFGLLPRGKDYRPWSGRPAQLRARKFAEMEPEVAAEIKELAA